MKRTFLVSLMLLSVGCAPSATSSAGALPTTGGSSATPVALSTPATVVAAVTPGAPAPTPPAVDQNGKPVKFADLYKKGPVLVYFYPKADTPGCTAQACSLRDSYQKLTDAGLTVVGVSTDNQAAQKAFQAKYKLPFVLVSDPEQVVLKAFGVTGLGGMANREAFLVKDGAVTWHDGSASTSKQADDVLAQIATWK